MTEPTATDRLERELRGTAAHGALSPRTVDAVARRADAEGLIDVAYARADSPLGPLTVAATEHGLALLAYPTRPLDEVLGRLAAQISPRVLEAPARLDPVRRQLDEYFDGKRTEFDLPIDWQLTRGAFFQAVLRATAQIGYGETLTYRQVAERAGNVKAVRAAGNGLGSNPIPVVIPCHRVTATGGGLGGYTGGLERKELLLALER
ncbi:MAG: methylated-DNA--[protein]-cysteine S-methyltransferase, partial [Thermoleophilaceae bacterium]